MWTLLLIKLLASLLLISATTLISDWVFNGSKWAHKFYAHAPNIWRPMEPGDPHHVEQRIVRTSLLVTVGFSIAFIAFYFVMRPGLLFSHPLYRGIATGLFLWLLTPLPLLLTQHLYVKYHRATTMLQLANWFVKLTIASLIMTYLF